MKPYGISTGPLFSEQELSAATVSSEFMKQGLGEPYYGSRSGVLLK